MSGPPEFNPSENILNENVVYENKQAVFDSLGPLMPFIRTIRVSPDDKLEDMDMLTIQYINNEIPQIANWPVKWNDLKVFSNYVNLKLHNVPSIPFGPFRL
jgi:hypothetical protein